MKRKKRVTVYRCVCCGYWKVSRKGGMCSFCLLGC